MNTTSQVNKTYDQANRFNNYMPLRMVSSGTKYAANLKSDVGPSYKSLIGLRGGYSGFFPSEQNTQNFSLASSNFSSEDYRAMSRLKNTRELMCDEVQRKIIDLKFKMDVAKTDSEREKVKKEYEEALQYAYQNSCSFIHFIP
jgi:hypothetical protein